MLEAQGNKTLAIIGREDNIQGFKALGFNIHILADASGLPALCERIAAEGTAVCLVEESLYLSAENEMNKYRKMPLPIFLPFSPAGGEGAGVLSKMIKDIRLKATGAL